VALGSPGASPLLLTLTSLVRTLFFCSPAAVAFYLYTPYYVASLHLFAPAVSFPTSRVAIHSAASTTSATRRATSNISYHDD
jgi:hypothetical protein